MLDETYPPAAKRCAGIKPALDRADEAFVPSEQCVLEEFHASNCRFDSDPQPALKTVEERVAFIERHVGDHAEALALITKAERTIAELRFEVACARAEALRTKDFVEAEMKRMNSARYKRPSMIGLIHRFLNLLEKR